MEFPDKLLDGYRVFMTERFPQARKRYQALASEGQKPETMVIACCDSRAAPEDIFSVEPGEIFVMRNIANQVPPFQPDNHHHATSAALEYAVQALQVKHIVVLGHGHCGGIKNALDLQSKPLSSDDFIGRWMNLIAPAAQTVAANNFMTDGEQETALERISIRYSVANLLTFPWLAKRHQRGLLSLHGAWFDISSGELWVMNSTTGDFARVDVPDNADQMDEIIG